MNCLLCKDDERLTGCPLCDKKPLDKAIAAAFRIGNWRAAYQIDKRVSKRCTKAVIRHNFAGDSTSGYVDWEIPKRKRTDTVYSRVHEFILASPEAEGLHYNPYTGEMVVDKNSIVIRMTSALPAWRPGLLTVKGVHPAERAVEYSIRRGGEHA